MSPRTFDWFGWPSTPEANHRIYPHKLRDGAAFSEILAMLTREGYVYRDVLLNFRDGDDEPVAGSCANLIVMVTRPTLSEDAKKPIQRSHSRQENEIIKAIEPYFEACSRDLVMLHDCVARRIGPPTRDRAEIVFHQYSDWAWYKRLRGMTKDINIQDPAQRRTAAYLVYVPRITSSGPALLVAFGMGGNDTLLWSRILRDQYSDQVREILRSDRARFLMAELTPREGDPGEPLCKFQTLSDIARRWEVRIVVDCEP